MSSSRFPGKMLAPLNGIPLVKHIVSALSQVSEIDHVVVLTSVEQSDDPLAYYLEKEGYSVFRGDLNNVFFRFQQALKAYPCDSFVRICGDSPIISTALVQYMVCLAQDKGCDFLSNVYHQKFPKGQSIEIVVSDIFMGIDAQALTSEQREHVMPYFYDHAEQYNVCFPDCTSNDRALNTCVDTVEDLKNIAAGDIVYHFKEDTIIC